MATHHVIEAPATPSLLPLVGLGAYFVASIFYVFPSGNPQPADFLLLLTIVATLLVAWRRLPYDPVLYIAIALFSGWIVVVNVVWFFLSPDFVFLKKTSFYLYNAVVFLFVVSAGYHDWQRLKVVIWWSCVIALLAQLLYLELWYVGEGKRATGTFNNPNQLGYWALLVMACLAVVKERNPLGILDVLALGAGFYVLMLALSKAASISGMLLVLLILAFCRLQRASGLVLSVALVLGVLFQVASGGLVERFMSFESVANLDHRLSTIGESEDDDLLHRGYIRLIQNPQYLAFGAGEGGFERLTQIADKQTKELHSTLGTILMSYGLVGLALFGLLLFVIFGRAPLASIAYLGPVMLYSVTHVGVRFSEFWIFLALVYAQARFGTWGAPTVGPSSDSARW
jgi:O-antigen ligase